MNISEPSRLVIENADWLKSSGLYLKDENGEYLQKDVACRCLKYVAAQIAIFFCRLFHFLKTWEWLNDTALLEKIKLRIESVKSFSIESLLSKQEKFELSRTFSEISHRVDPKTIKINPFDLEVELINFDKKSVKFAELKVRKGSGFIWSDDENYNKKQFPNKSTDRFNPDFKLLDGSSIPIGHGDYLIPLEIDNMPTYLPSSILLHDEPENRSNFFKLRYKEKILKVQYPKFEAVRDSENFLCKTFSFGSHKGAFSIKYLELNPQSKSFYPSLFSSKRPQFQMPTSVHKKNLANPLPLSFECIRLDDLIINQKEYSKGNRSDYTFYAKDRTVVAVSNKPILKECESCVQIDINKTFLRFSIPVDTINISLFDDFMYVYGELSEPDNICGRKIINTIESNVPKSYGAIYDKRQGYSKDRLMITDIKYGNGFLYIPLKTL